MRLSEIDDGDEVFAPVTLPGAAAPVRRAANAVDYGEVAAARVLRAVFRQQREFPVVRDLVKLRRCDAALPECINRNRFYSRRLVDREWLCERGRQIARF